MDRDRLLALAASVVTSSASQLAKKYPGEHITVAVVLQDALTGEICQAATSGPDTTTPMFEHATNVSIAFGKKLEKRKKKVPCA